MSLQIFFLALFWFGGRLSATELPKIGLKEREEGNRVFYEIDSGREVIFHGVNSIVKGFPWVPSTDEFDIDTSLTEFDHEALADLGICLVSLTSSSGCF